MLYPMEFSHEIKNKLSTLSGLLDLLMLSASAQRTSRLSSSATQLSAEKLKEMKSYELLMRQVLRDIATTSEDFEYCHNIRSTSLGTMIIHEDVPTLAPQLTRARSRRPALTLSTYDVATPSPLTSVDLTLSLSHAETYPPRRQVVVRQDLRQLLGSIIQLMLPTAATHSVRLELKTSGVDPARGVQVNCVKFRHLVNNLLSNACKYNRIGGIASVTLWENHITISDNGIGMTVDELQHAPSHGYRARRVERAGSGLGLYISKTICDELGFRLSMQSWLGEGTLATIQFRKDVVPPD